MSKTVIVKIPQSQFDDAVELHYDAWLEEGGFLDSDYICDIGDLTAFIIRHYELDADDIEVVPDKDLLNESN